MGGVRDVRHESSWSTVFGEENRRKIEWGDKLSYYLILPCKVKEKRMPCVGFGRDQELHRGDFRQHKSKGTGYLGNGERGTSRDGNEIPNKTRASG